MFYKSSALGRGRVGGGGPGFNYITTKNNAFISKSTLICRK